MRFSIITGALALVTAVQAQLNPWQARHAMSAAQYQTTFNDLTSQGYRLNWVSGYTINGAAAYAAIFEKKPSPDWVANHGMTSADYQSKFNTYTSQGYRLVVVNGYTVNGIDYYAAIFDKSPSGAWVARHGMNSADYQSNFNTYTSQGYRLVHVSGYSVGTEARYAAIWQKTTDGIAWEAHHGMTSAEYQAQFDRLSKAGYRLTLVSGYQVNNVDYFAAIWDKKSGPLFIARHDMTSDQYQRQFDNNYYQGYMLKVISGYNTGLSDRYAAIWENGPISSTDMATIDNDISAYITKYSIPGLSFAITKDDRLVFAKGYGMADQASSTIVTPNSLFRIMSISKSITSTAVMKLIQDGHFNLTSKVFGPGSVTGTKYGNTIVNGKKVYKAGVTDITIQQLLEHISGYDGSADPETTLKSQTTFATVSTIIDSIPLAATPATKFAYSNFNFLILGCVIADVMGQDYETWVKTNIFGPAGATKMQLANNAGSLPNEVTYYPLGASGSFRIHEFSSFGGWVGTPIDLLRWSTKIDTLSPRPDILSPATLTSMFTGSSINSGYGKGMILSNGWRGHNGAFGGTGSYFVQKTDKSGLGFALVMNTNAVGDEYSDGIRGVVDGILGKVASWPGYDLF
ncbi:beta-lactamase [Tricladium varicosporioides]|nr:beta-lactamase [Hymenoscyphus varicosporioides]